MAYFAPTVKADGRLGRTAVRVWEVEALDIVAVGAASVAEVLLGSVV
jgi:hypothetical protein